ncbi:MAG TPA: Gfo/Idh/MocA family oxidoreductase [Rhodothermales bacterium]|nr:Gfo/Idh/MocA family oxidoreductase [Rhodothermales bacterium]
MAETSNPVRVALVGLGGHGLTIQRAVESAENLQVVAVCDLDPSEMRAAAERFGCDAVPSYDQVLARDDVDAVSLVTPNHLHRAQAEAAFAAGRDVFVEKPIANTVAEGLSMVQAAEAAGRVLMVGHNMRFSPAAQDARETIHQGRLGQIVSAEIHFSSDTVRQLASNAWRLHPDQCSLLPVMQLGIHAIDLMHFLLGPIREVFALSRTVLAPAGVVDSVSATFRIEGGPLGTMVSNYCTPVLFEYRIAGTEGLLHCTPHHYSFRRRDEVDRDGDGAPASSTPGAGLVSYVRQMRAFGEAVRRGAPSRVTGWDGLQALAVVDALRLSSETGAPQRVADVRAEVMG